MTTTNFLRWTSIAVLAGLVAAEGGKTPSGGATGGAKQGPTPADLENTDISYWLGWIWVVIIGSFIVYQVVFHFIRYVRTVACLSNETQRYFAAPSVMFGRFKKYFLDAPLFRTRHHREFKLSTAINAGTLPSRLQMAFLVGYFGTNVAFCVISINWSGTYKEVASEFRNRTGVLAVMNMLPLFLLAGRNNPFITFCGISFDTFNLIHRWFGRIVVLEAITHSFAFIASKVHSTGWSSLAATIKQSDMIMWGVVGTASFIFILLHSPSAIRHAFYETFLHFHIAAVSLAVAAVWIHLKELPQLRIMYGVVSLWVFERTCRLILIIMRNVGSGGTKADVEVLPGDAVRVTIRMARPWKFRPGQHAYIYMPSVGLWTNHPFSLAWSDEEEDLSEEKGLAMNRQDILEMRKTSISMIIRRRTGFTERLFKKADLSPAGKFTTSALIEGPYGGENLTSYGTVMLWAAGIGITHQVPHVRDIVASFANGTTATRRLTLVWIIQSPEHLEWIRSWMTTILSMPRRRDVLKILLFVTRPRSTKEIHSPSSSVQMFPGKPNVQALIDQEMQEGVGAACVSVCGTGGLADDVRRAVRMRETVWNVDFREESFSW